MKTSNNPRCVSRDFGFSVLWYYIVLVRVLISCERWSIYDDYPVFLAYIGTSTYLLLGL